MIGTNGRDWRVGRVANGILGLSADEVGFFVMTPSSILLSFCMTMVAGALAWSAINDVRAYRIPNWTSILIVVAFLIVAVFTPYAPLMRGLFTGFAVLCLGIGMFALGWMGGGDVKLFSALAVWSGPSLLAPFALITCLAGAALALIMLSPLGRLAPQAPTKSKTATGQPMPYGVAIAAGGAWVLSQYAKALV